jgi:hypothetical protein
VADGPHRPSTRRPDFRVFSRPATTEDPDAFDVISADEDVTRLQPRARFGIAAQTTQPIERVRRLASLIRSRFPLSEDSDA